MLFSTKVKVFALIVLLLTLSCKSTRPPAPDSINIAVPYEIDTLDPQAKTRLSNFSVAFNFYEPLVRTDEDMKLVPALAVRWENPDAYTWIFHLQPSVRFHDGKPMKAQDVVYSLNRLLTDPNLEVSSLLTNIVDVVALDPESIRIRTNSPITLMLNKLSFVAIVPDGSTSESLSANVDGTGPYRLLRWERGSAIHMVRNEDYWGEKAPLQKVNFYLSQTPKEAIASLTSHKCRLAQCNSKDLEAAIGGSQDLEMLRHDSLFLKYLSFDMSRKITPYCSVTPNPFQNKMVRQAINIAIDRQRLVTELLTYSVPVNQPVPPFAFGYNPQIELPQYDPAEARNLMAKAGYQNGFDVTLHTRQILAGTGLVVKDQLLQIGIRVDLKVLPDPEFFQALDKHEFSFFVSRIATTIGDASDVLEGALHTRDVSGHYGAINYIGYSNPEVDRGIEESAGMLKVDQRRDRLQKIMSVLMDDLPWIPLYIDQDVYAIDKAFRWNPRNDSMILAQTIHPRQ
jgi:peptide/nickel transport system substrate-binding protein